MIEWVLAGTATGFLTGLIPGLHVNLLLPILLSSPSPIFIISTSIAFVFSSVFPSILLSVPSSSDILLLPSQKLVMKGEALKAIRLSTYSMLFSTLFSIPLSFLLFLIQKFYTAFETTIPFLLVLVLFSFAFKKPKGLIVIFLSSILGFLTFNHNLLTPLLTGFFAVPNFFLMLNSSNFPQKLIPFNIDKKIIRISFIASFLSSFFSIIPAVSSSIVSSASTIFGKMDDDEFVSFISSSNLSYMAFSFYAFLFLGVTRSGSAVLLRGTEGNFFFYAGAVLFSAGAGFFFSQKLAKKAVVSYQKTNKKKLASLGILLVSSICFFEKGLLGLLVLLTSSTIGLLALKTKTPRVYCMSALITPTAFALI